MDFNNDEYTCEIDQLGYKKQAETIRNLILNCESPYAIGISGRWGSGKTSMMKYIMASLGGKPMEHRLKFQDNTISNNKEVREFKKVNSAYPHGTHGVPTTCLWFNPWEFESHDEPFVELLKEIHHYFSTTALAKITTKIAHTSIIAGLDMLGSFLKLGRNSGSNIKKIGEAYERENFEYVDRSQQFKLIFQAAVKKLLDGCHGKGANLDVNNKARLVIFIDDLDRCEEGVVVKLLKDIKQHLSTKHCIFVFGYDRHHIESSMCQSNDRTTKDSRAYLEKLFQSTIYIKQPTKNNLKEYIQTNLNRRTSAIKFIPNHEVIALSDFLIKILDPNPRRLKAFFTSYYLHVKTSQGFSLENNIEIDDLKKLALLTYLKLFFEPVYSALENDLDILKAIVNVFDHNDQRRIDSYQEAFVYLETRSHLSSDDVVLSSDGSDNINVFKDSESENKFIAEVQQMQGKHKSHSFFMSEFKDYFHPHIANKTNFDDYL